MKRIGTKLALQIAAAIILGMMAFGGLDIYQKEHRERLALSSKIASSVQQLATIMENLLFDMYYEQTEYVIRSYLTDRDILSIKLLDGEKIVRYLGKSPDKKTIVDLVQQPVTYVETEFKQQHLDYNGKAIGTIEVVFSRSFITEQREAAIGAYVKNLLIVIVLQSLAVIFLVNQHITRPLLAIVHAAERIADGAVDISLKKTTARDEIGTLTRTFETMVAYLKNMANIATGIAAGDLRQTVTPRTDHDMLGQAFLNMSTYLNQMATWAASIAEGDLSREIESKTDQDVLGKTFQQEIRYLRHSMSEIMESVLQLRNASTELSDVSELMASSTEQTSQQTFTVSSNSQEISENVNTVAAAIEELSASIRETSKNTMNVAQIAGLAVEKATISNTTIADLAARSQEISDIITVITSVTQQTNLLALNATIEAARAGDFGKGFAVVANEIKELSRETARSAEDIIRKIEAIQSGTGKATETINDVLKINTQIRDISRLTANEVEQQSATTTDIAHRIVEAATGSTEINEVIAEVAAATQENSKSASKVQNAAQVLAELANHLQRLVGRFKI